MGEKPEPEPAAGAEEYGQLVKLRERIDRQYRDGEPVKVQVTATYKVDIKDYPGQEMDVQVYTERDTDGVWKDSAVVVEWWFLQRIDENPVIMDCIGDAIRTLEREKYMVKK